MRCKKRYTKSLQRVNLHVTMPSPFSLWSRNHRHRPLAPLGDLIMPVESDWMSLLLQACAIDSRTAAGAAGTSDVARLFGARLEALGFTLHWSDPDPAEGPRGRHLRAIRNPGASPRILLFGHTDTVLGPDAAPVTFDDASGRLLGAGACDMKGGCVLMLEALRLALAADDAVSRACLEVMLNCSEETSGPSFRALAQTAGPGAKACLSFEPARLGPNGLHRIVIARKGGVRFSLHCRGRAAHAGIDHAYGVNAIREIARQIEWLEALTDDARDLTVNVGLVSGGQATNQVADEAAIQFEARAYDPRVLDAACERIRQHGAQSTVTSRSDGATPQLRLETTPTYPAWPRCKASDALANRYQAIAGRHGLNVEAISSGGGADASYVAGMIPTLDGLGILGGNLHQPGEWADVRSFPARSAVAAELIGELCAEA